MNYLNLRKNTILYFCLLFLIKISAQNLENFITLDYISLTSPISYEGDLRFIDSNNLVTKKSISELKHDSSLLNSLSNLVSSVTIYEKKDGASLSLLGNSLSKKNNSYLVIYDFTQTQLVEHYVPESDLTYVALVGVSIRMVANITSKKANINLTDILKLGLEAEKENIKGSLEVRVSGINSKVVNQLIPVTSDFSKSSIANALQSVATIKSHLYDIETKITPMIIAFTVTGKKQNQIDIRQLTKNMKALKFQ